tara:strand:- start:88 stop:534 length:447 start_codon:yes stop_codon:yes gene_type:complete
MKVNFKLNSPCASLPRYAHEDDAGVDITSTETIVIQPKQAMIIPTGLSVEMSLGFILKWFFKPVMILKSRSGLACKNRLEVGAGVIDKGYTGEIKVLLHNHGSFPYTVHIGDKICQAVFHTIPKVKVGRCINLSSSVRGDNGFGSTDK